MEVKNEQESFLNDLKYQTAKSHKQLEDNPLSGEILSASVSANSYQSYLSKLYSIHKACEDQIYPVLRTAISDLQRRIKSTLITSDLIATGFSSKRIAQLPVHHFQTSDLPEALGIMYVLEGSTLGGRILFRHIQEKLGFDAGNGASFFAGYGADTGIMWKTFIYSLEREALAGKFQQRIIASAVDTFKIIDDSLSQVE